MAESAEPLIARADLIYAKGRCDEAVGLLTESLARNPAQADIVTRLAEILMDSGWHAQALEFLENINADENNARALLLRGLCHYALGIFLVPELWPISSSGRTATNPRAGIKSPYCRGVSGER